MYKNVSLSILIGTSYLFGGFYDDDIYELKSLYSNNIYKNPSLEYNKNIYKVTPHPIHQLVKMKYDRGNDGIIDNIQSFEHDTKGNVLSSTTSDFDNGESQYFTYDSNSQLLSTYRDTGYSHLDVHNLTYNNGYLISSGIIPRPLGRNLLI